jgi:hypothetical protein
VTDYNQYAAETPDMKLVQRILTGHPDHGQLIAFLSRSYEYIRKLPLRGLRENYSTVYLDLFSPGL